MNKTQGTRDKGCVGKGMGEGKARLEQELQSLFLKTWNKHRERQTVRQVVDLICNKKDKGQGGKGMEKEQGMGIESKD